MPGDMLGSSNPLLANHISPQDKKLQGGRLLESPTLPLFFCSILFLMHVKTTKKPRKTKHQLFQGK